VVVLGEHPDPGEIARIEILVAHVRVHFGKDLLAETLRGRDDGGRQHEQERDDATVSHGRLS
jgi:hypothetical protein